MNLGAELSYARDSLKVAATKIGASDFGAAAFFMDAAADRLGNAAVDIYHASFSVQAYTNNIFNWINDNWPEAVEVTYQTIVEAWIKDDFEGRAITIAMIDRMRQILWNEPFYVRWAARPETSVE